MMASEDEPIYCLCRLPYDETRFMIECDVCKDWFHGGCVGVQEHQAADIEIYHCPNCAPKHGPLVLKKRRNWHRHDYSEDGSKLTTAVQTGTVVFIKDLKKRSFPSADEIPIKRLSGGKVTIDFFDDEGFDVPIVCEKKEGLGLTLPPPSFNISDVEQLVGSMREIDVIDVARQEDIKMIMREWTEYYNSPNREKILNVISLEFSNTRLSELVAPPSIISKISWAKTMWPEQLPDDSSLVRPEVQKYCLMGVKDSFTDFHIDFGGTSVWYHILRGEKVFYLIRPTQKNLDLYEAWLSSSKQSETFFGDKVDKCYRIVVKQAHTLFIPTGWIHAVLTPIDSLVFGGNFLHNYNVPLQLQCYEIERNVKTPDKYLFPSYETMNWYAAKTILDMLKEFTEEKKLPPTHLIDGARALSIGLKAWTHRKDYAKVSKQDAADYIQYGKVLKELTKEVKAIDAMKPATPKKADQKRKRNEKEKPTKAAKKLKGLEGLEILEEHTQETLKAAEKSRRESIYNFEDEEEDEEMPLSLKVRIPKAGAYQPEVEKKETKGRQKGESALKLSSTEGPKSGSKSSKAKPAISSLGKDDKPNVSAGKARKGKKEKSRNADVLPVVAEDVKTEEEAPSTPLKEVPQCLKFKLSNGKMVSTDKKSKPKKFRKKEFMLLGADIKDEEEEVVTPPEEKKAKISKTAASSKKKTKKGQESTSKKSEILKKETDLMSPTPEKLKKESVLKSPEKLKKEPVLKSPTSKKSEKLKKELVLKSPTSKKSEKLKKEPVLKSSTSKKSEKLKKEPVLKSPTSKKSEKSKTKSKSKTKKEPSPAAVPHDSDSDGEHLVVDENPKKVKSQKTTSTTKPASLKMKLPSATGTGKASGTPGSSESQEESEMQSRLGMDTIRGGLNGSISDILTASGYGTETAFKVDSDGSGMRDAIAGMLTMSRMGHGEEDPLFSHGEGGEKNSKLKISAAEEEKRLMADCYEDSEFVYPSFELSEDEDGNPQKLKKKPSKDDSWNPKARVRPTVTKPERDHREGVQKKSMTENLAATATKLAESASQKKQKKDSKPKPPELLEFEVQPLPGPSSSIDDPPVNAFRPGIKRPVDPCAMKSSLDQSNKSKKPKKGFATAKQRLGKLLKIRKMVF